MAVMAVLLPLPGYIASFIHELQAKKMNMVRRHEIRISKADNRNQTDARVQSVTESQYEGDVYDRKPRRSCSSPFSAWYDSNDQTLRLGASCGE